MDQNIIVNMKVRYPNTRGVLKNNWIESRRTFSNNSYWDPKYMNYYKIHVLNDDILYPGKMVPKHQHKNYEILGYIVYGKLEHEDSIGNKVEASTGQIQYMSCGSSIFHTEKCISEYPARYLQIWIEPNIKNTSPSYSIINKSPSFGEVELIIKQDISIKSGKLNGLNSLNIINNGYLYIISGSVIINNEELIEGTGIELNNEELYANFIDSHIILFEL